MDVCAWCVCLCLCVVGCVDFCVSVCVYGRMCWCDFFLYSFIYQHPPLLVSNNTCIDLSFTYSDLSCLYTFVNIY